MKRGALIVIEGCDHSGKTTECKMLEQRLTAEGIKVSSIHFPDRTTSIGQIIDEYLKKSVEMNDQAIHLLFSANRWELMEDMKKKLLDGTTLIVDRYAFSGVAFTAAKGLDLNWCKQPDVGLLKPDKVIYLEVTGKVAAGRSDFGRERYENLEFQEKVDQKYKELVEPSYWATLDVDLSVEEVHARLYEIAIDVIKNAESAPLRKLWVD